MTRWINNTTPSQKATMALLLAGLFALSTPVAHAESLFRAGIGYQASQAFTPHSLYAVPRPAVVGDSVTITINETTAIDVQNTSTITSKQTLNENGTNIVSSIVQRVFGVKDLFPSVDGVNNDHEITDQGEAKKSYTFTDTVTCQVVQILPNGHLVVQGKKTILSSKEKQDLYVSGIVNPYYIDSANTIKSNQVANLQMNVVGSGVVSRQQGDSLLSKYYQYAH